MNNFSMCDVGYKKGLSGIMSKLLIDILEGLLKKCMRIIICYWLLQI